MNDGIYGTPAPASENWIAWTGGKRPVPGEERVDVVFRTGARKIGIEARSSRWTHWQSGKRQGPRDIIFYRTSREALAGAQ